MDNGDHGMEQIAAWLRLARLGNENITSLRKEFVDIAIKIASQLAEPEDLHHLLKISKRYMGYGELLGEDFLPIIRPIFNKYALKKSA